MLEIAASGQSGTQGQLQSSLGVTQALEQTQLMGTQGDLTQMGSQKKTGNLDFLNSLDAQIKRKHTEREKADKDKRLSEKFKVSTREGN